MEIKKRARFTTDFYGGKAYLPGDTLVKNWLESQHDRLLHPRFKELKDALGNEEELEKILSVFNTNGEGEPIIGSWMLKECSMDAAQRAGIWNKFKVSFDQWKDSIGFSPLHVGLYNGGAVNTPHGVEVYTVTVKRGPNKGRSFFKSYQYVNAGTEFEFTLTVADDLCVRTEGRGQDKIFHADEERVALVAETVLNKMCTVGIGAYRLRFGNFQYI